MHKRQYSEGDQSLDPLIRRSHVLHSISVLHKYLSSSIIVNFNPTPAHLYTQDYFSCCIDYMISVRTK